MLAVGCTRDFDDRHISGGEGETWVTLDFGNRAYDEIAINTRSTLSETAESRVMNLYVFIFDGNGSRIYGHYFDTSQLLTDEETVKNAQRECWYVKNKTEGSTETTKGRIRARVPLIDGGGEICIIANIDADMGNISPEQLNYIHSKKDLAELSASLNQLITSRNGYFPMSGSKGGISITKTAIMADGTTDFTVPLHRLDAKISVNIKIAENTSSSTDVDYDADGDGVTEPATRTQSIVEFRPESWQVMNLPRGCFILERDKTADTFDSETGYFNTDAVNFETVTAKQSGFSFYMLENRTQSKSPAGNFNGRDLRIKDAAGAYDTSDGLWVNAPEDGTYLIINGEVVMNVDVSSEAKQQQLNASVTYYIHLGDFGSDVDNYDVDRNTSYTYNITIKGVDSIQAEVEKNIEAEPAATGDVYIAKESIHTFDAHYGKRAFSFDEAFITPSTVTWYVKTPFGREGVPTVINGVEVPNGLDYEWVHFMVNDQSDPADAASSYSRLQMHYSPQAMNVVDFVAYIKDQKRRFDSRKAKYPDDPAQWIVGNDFRAETDPDYPEGQRTRYRIWVTVFVDEYYYEEDPISGDKNPLLWRRFINQPNRVMHLLCDTNFSSDHDSSTTGSVVTIRQRSIQSIFDPSASVNNAWGCETVDEVADKLWFFDDRETGGSSDPYLDKTNYGNNAPANGLYNSARLWGLIENDKFKTGQKWDDYLDFERENDHELGYLKDGDDEASHKLRTARYACLMRNRDNNGDGVIDASEVRWYMASVLQVTNLYIGQMGLSGDAILYPQSRAELYKTLGNVQDADGFYPWRSHIITSTNDTETNGPLPTIVWAEEGLSTSAYNMPKEWGRLARHTVRCVRNIGSDPQSEAEAQTLLEKSDLPFISVVQVSGPGVGDNTETPTSESVYRFDLSNMNRKSIRFYTTKELEVSDEYDEMSRPYLIFETGPLCTVEYTYSSMSSLLDEGRSPCPEGYRVPNMRELAMMAAYIPAGWWTTGQILSSTYFSIQPERYWIAKHKHLNQTDDNAGKLIRCVRDVK